MPLRGPVKRAIMIASVTGKQAMAAATERLCRAGSIGIALILIVCFFPEPTAAQNAEDEWNRLNGALLDTFQDTQTASCFPHVRLLHIACDRRHYSIAHRGSACLSYNLWCPSGIYNISSATLCMRHQMARNSEWPKWGWGFRIDCFSAY